MSFKTATIKTFITHRMNRLAIGAATLATAGIIAFGGLSSVGAQATGTYQCGTYGGGDYNQTDCTDPVTPAPSTGTGSTGSSSGSTGSTGSTSGSTTSGSTGSSSTGSSSTGTTTPTTTTPAETTPTAPSGSILLNAFSEYRTSKGKSLTFALNDKFYFNLKGAQHSITIKSISSTQLIVTIASTPTDVTIPVGQTVAHDVDGDGTDDVSISYAEATGNITDGVKGTAAFRALSSTTDVSTQSGSTGSTSNGATTEGKSSMGLLWIIPVIVGLGIIVTVAVVIAKRRKAANAGGGNFSQF